MKNFAQYWIILYACRMKASYCNISKCLLNWVLVVTVQFVSHFRILPFPSCHICLAWDQSWWVREEHALPLKFKYICHLFRFSNPSHLGQKASSPNVFLLMHFVMLSLSHGIWIISCLKDLFITFFTTGTAHSYPYFLKRKFQAVLLPLFMGFRSECIWRTMSMAIINSNELQ